jgi:site-specific recombinase XerD
MAVLKFREYLEANLSPASAARVFNTCRAFYKWARQPNPFEFIKSTKKVRNRVPKVPSDVAIEALLRLTTDKREKVVIALLLNGLRSEEVTTLMEEDYVYVEQYDTYILRVVGKGRKERLVPANRILVEAMSNYLSMRNLASPWLIQAPEGKQMTTRQVQYIVEKNSGGALRPHALRHHYATRLIRSGAGAFSTRDLLGHESVATTQIYVTLDLGDIIRAAELDPLNRKEPDGENVHSDSDAQ